MELRFGNRLQELPGPILITGHTGFKGTWLTFLLERLGVPMIGLSLAPEINSLFDRTHRIGAIPETFSDIRDLDAVIGFMTAHRPSAVIHMAAQPLVLESYKTPRETFETNVMGTVNVLESSFKTDSVEAVVVVTTDKVYRNDNSGRAFIESDPLAGKDPYSASKVGTEAAVAAWQQLSKVQGGPRVLSVRAGNVIGGGDWAEDRLIPDLIRGFISGSMTPIRNPVSTRPWQHVLDPLSGYLMALEAGLNGVTAEAFNFGPNESSLSVGEVFTIANRAWGIEVIPVVNQGGLHAGKQVEAESLSLDSNLSHSSLGWEPIWSQESAVISSIQWWKRVLNESASPYESCKLDIEQLKI